MTTLVNGRTRPLLSAVGPGSTRAIALNEPAKQITAVSSMGNDPFRKFSQWLQLCPANLPLRHLSLSLHPY